MRGNESLAGIRPEIAKASQKWRAGKCCGRRWCGTVQHHSAQASITIEAMTSCSEGSFAKTSGRLVCLVAHDSTNFD